MLEGKFTVFSILTLIFDIVPSCTDYSIFRVRSLTVFNFDDGQPSPPVRSW